MNKWIGIGRLTKEPEIKLTSNQTQFCNFTIAVDRRFKDANGQRQTDFINCIAWKQTAVFIQKYFKKGNRIGISGCIQTRSFEDQNGQKHFITEVLAEEAEFVESQPNTTNSESTPSESVDVPDPRATQEVAELPFEI